MAETLYGEGWSGRIERRLEEGEKRFTELERTCGNIANELLRLGKDFRAYTADQKVRNRHPSFSDEDLDLPTGVTRVRELPDKARQWRAERDEAVALAVTSAKDLADAEHRRRMAVIKAYVGGAISIIGAIGTAYGMLR